MDQVICCTCVEDHYLSKLIQDEGEQLECSVCGESTQAAITVERLGQIMEPILRDNFEHGQDVKHFGENDSEWWDREGDSLAEITQEVLGQYFDFQDDIADAIREAEDYHPGRGEEAYWDVFSSYVPTGVHAHHYFARWRNTLDELKFSRRFFSPAAKSLFDDVFQGIDELRAGRRNPVARTLPKGMRLYRARVSSSRSEVERMFKDPMKEVGPPPRDKARPGRMNAEGVVVLYAALDPKTCMAEMRPAIGSEIAVIEMTLSQPLRVLDFTRLDAARSGKALSYFQPDFKDQLQRRAFLRRLHNLISQPVVPGHETDYLITQTMSEYLAHVHQRPFDGVLFSSAQRAGGINIVLFPEPDLLSDDPSSIFRVEYVDGSIKLYSTNAIRYDYEELSVSPDADGKVWVWQDTEKTLDEGWE